MSRQATEQERAVAREIAGEVARRGGRVTVPVDEPLAMFDVRRFTDASRDRIDEALERAKVSAEPSIYSVARGDSVTLTTRQRMRPVPAVTRKKRWYRRPAGVAGLALLALLLIVAVLGGGSESEAPSTVGTTPMPDARAAALALADEALAADDYRAVLAAATDVGGDLVDRYERKIARRLLRRARTSLRESSERAAIDRAERSEDFHRFPEARTIATTARTRLAAERRAARLARDRRTCDSGEKETVRFGGATPAGCSGYAVQLAAERAREEAEAAAALPDESADDGGGDGSGNWCGATRDGDGVGIWCEGR